MLEAGDGRARGQPGLSSSALARPLASQGGPPQTETLRALDQVSPRAWGQFCFLTTAPVGCWFWGQHPTAYSPPGRWGKQGRALQQTPQQLLSIKSLICSHRPSHPKGSHPRGSARPSARAQTRSCTPSPHPLQRLPSRASPRELSRSGTSPFQVRSPWRLCLDHLIL